jgi:adenylate cyclase
VRYVLEGSVRKASNRVRVTAQLIEATSGGHVWAERYDRELADIFAIQDEVTQAIVATLPGRVEAASRERAARKTPDSLAAYEWVLTAKVLHHRSQREANAQAQEMLDRAIALDPKYAHAHAWKACVLGQTWVNGWCEDREATQERIFEELQTALALDDNDSDVHRILAAVHVIRNLHDLAQYHQQRALSLNPNDDLIVVQQGELLTWLGEASQGVEWIRKAMRLNPYHPERFWSHLGRAHFVARDYLQAADAFRRITAVQFAHHAFLAACHARLGDATNARLQADAVLALAPAFTVDAYLQTLYYKRDEDRTHHRDSLLQAGLPA